MPCGFGKFQGGGRRVAHSQSATRRHANRSCCWESIHCSVSKAIRVIDGPATTVKSRQTAWCAKNRGLEQPLRSLKNLEGREALSMTRYLRSKASFTVRRNRPSVKIGARKNFRSAANDDFPAKTDAKLRSRSEVTEGDWTMPEAVPRN